MVHVHSGFADYFMVSGLLKSHVDLPTFHTTYCPIAPTGRWRFPVVHTLIKRWANRLDWRGAMSVNTANSLVQYGIRDVEVMRPAVDRERFSHPAERIAARRELGIGENDLVVLFVGNAKPQKNAMGMLRAVHRLRPEFPQIKLVITTELRHTASDTDLARLAREVCDLDLDSCLLQLGIVRNMPALMQACDVLVAPFLDSYGPSDYFMAVLEAMASGKPVVVSNVGGMREVVSDDVGRLIDPHDVESIAAGMRELLVDKELRLRTGANARSYVEKHFDPDTIVSAQQSVYRRFIS